MVGSSVVESGFVGLGLVLSSSFILRVVGSSEVVSSEMVLRVVDSGSTICVATFVISVVVGIVVLELAGEVLILTPPEGLSLPPPSPPISFLASPPPSPPAAPPKVPSVVASPLFPSLVVADSPSVVRGLSMCLSIKLQGSATSKTGMAAVPSCSINPSWVSTLFGFTNYFLCTSSFMSPVVTGVGKDEMKTLCGSSW